MTKLNDFPDGSYHLHWNAKGTGFVCTFFNPYHFKPGEIIGLYDAYYEVREVYEGGYMIHCTWPTRTPQSAQDRLIAEVLPYVKPESIAIDVGAHTGEHAIAYAKAGAEVHAFEPNPVSFAYLVNNVGNLNVSCHHAAVGEKSGSARIKWSPECLESGHICGEGDAVTVVSLDQIYEEHKETFDVRGVSVLKIDVEGYEPYALKGAVTLIQTFRPVIVAEVQRDTLERHGFDDRDITQPMARLGYAWNPVLSDPRHNRGERYFFDLIATPLS